MRSAFLAVASVALLARLARADLVEVGPAERLVGESVLALGAEIAAPLDLDLGHRDLVDVVLAVGPDAAPDASATIRYETDGPPAPGAAHAFRLPAEWLLRDGREHTYRVDLGLELPWRGNLVRVDVVTDPGVACSELRVGDLPGDVYESRPTPQNPEAGEENELGEPVHVAESKRFRLLWSASSLAKGFDPSTQVHGTLRNLEECWQVLVKDMGLRPPHESWTEAARDGRRTKVNVSTWFDGYWAGGEDGDFGRLNVTGDGLRVDPPTWVVPHELCHVFQMHQESRLRGDWWESHADYAVEVWLARTAPLFEEPLLTAFNPGFAATAHYTTPWGGHYYLCWPIHLYLDENPDGLPGLGAGASTRAWREGGGEHDELWERVTTLTSVPRADLCGLWARRNVRWDYRNGAAMRRVVDGALADEALRRRIHTALVPAEARPGWWRVPLERAPQQFAYAVHRLEREGAAERLVVELDPLPSHDRPAGFRASLVVEGVDGASRLGEPFERGTAELSWLPGESTAYLVVAATPDDYLFGGHDDLVWPYGDHPQRRRFPYELRLDGARPAGVPAAGHDPTQVRPHPNGGGLVAVTAHVDESAWVGPRALVLDGARVTGRARVEGEAVVRDRAVVADDAVVSDHALVRGGARVEGRARVRDLAVVGGERTVVGGRAVVCHHASVQGGVHVIDDAIVRGCAEVFDGEGGTRIGGHAIVEGDAALGRGVSTGVHTGFMPWSIGPDEWIATRTSPSGLVAAYDFDAPASYGASDACGALDAFLRGAPRLGPAPGGEGPACLWLERPEQCAVLDPSLLDLSGAWAIRVTARADGSGAALLTARASGGRALRLELADGGGRPRFEITDGARTLELVGREPAPRGVFVELAVVASEGRVELRLDGETVARGEAVVEPEALLGEARDGSSGAVELLVGRDAATGDSFEGAVDALRVLRRAP